MSSGKVCCRGLCKLIDIVCLEQCVMITGDNPLTAVHVAQDVEIVDRDVMILDLKEGATEEDRELEIS